MAQSLTLDDLGRWGSGGTPSSSRSDYYDGSIPWVVIEDLNDGLVDKTIKKISKVGLENSSAKLVPAGTLLMAMYGSIGKLGITAMECATNQAIAFCRCDQKKVDTHYLFFYLLHNRDRFLQAGRGGTQQNINQDYLKNYKIELPSLGDQRRFVKLLLHADRLCRTRRYALELSDAFLPAVFAKLFGTKQFPRQPLEKLASPVRGSFVNGPFGSDLLTSELVLDGVPVIYIRDISAGRYLRTSTVCVTSEKAEGLANFSVQPGDVLVAKVGDPPGIAAIYPEGQPVGVITQDVIRIRLNRELALPEYLQGLLNSRMGKRFVKPIIVEGTRERFGLTPFKEISVPLPPLATQQQFAFLVAHHERLRATQREALRQAEHLFQTLLHRAFTVGI